MGRLPLAVVALCVACGRVDDSQCDVSTTRDVEPAPLRPEDMARLLPAAPWPSSVDQWDAQPDGEGGLWLVSGTSGSRASAWLDADGTIRRGPTLFADETCVVAGARSVICSTPHETRLIEPGQVLTNPSVGGVRPIVSGTRLGVVSDTEITWLERTTGGLEVESRVRMTRPALSVRADGRGGAWIVDEDRTAQRLLAEGSLRRALCGEDGAVDTHTLADGSALLWGEGRDGPWIATCDAEGVAAWSARLSVRLDDPVGGSGGLLTATSDEAIVLVADENAHVLLRHSLHDGSFDITRIDDPLGPSGIAFGSGGVWFSGAVALEGHDDGTVSILYGGPDAVGRVVRYGMDGARRGEPVAVGDVVHPALHGALFVDATGVWTIGEIFVQRIGATGRPRYQRGLSGCTGEERVLRLSDDGELMLLDESR